MADALSICGIEDEPTILATISFSTPVWLQQLMQTCSEDTVAQDLLTTLQQNPSSLALFSIRHSVLFRKSQIYMFNSQQFKLQILNTLT